MTLRLRAFDGWVLLAIGRVFSRAGARRGDPCRPIRCGRLRGVAACGTANLVHQLEEHPGVHLRACAQARLHPEMQARRSVHAPRRTKTATPTGLPMSEIAKQAFAPRRCRPRGPGGPRHAHRFPALHRFSMDCWIPTRHAMLVDVEEQQLFPAQRALVRRQFRCNLD